MSASLRRLHFGARLALRRATGTALGMRRSRAGRPLRLPKADFSLHMLLCHRDLEMGLWSLKSFCYFAEVSPEITIHDDGTLTARDVGILETQLARCRVVGRREADARMRSALSRHPHSRRMRDLPGFHCALKLFDPWVYASTERVLLLDSDVLFLRRPEQLIRRVQGEGACFLADYQDSYAIPLDALRRGFGFEVLRRVNAGIVAMGRAEHDAELVETYFERFRAPIRDPNRHEQTLYALLLTRANALRLGPPYQISREPIREGSVSHHFVDDGSRLGFATRGLRSLRGRGVLGAINGRSARFSPSSTPTRA